MPCSIGVIGPSNLLIGNAQQRERAPVTRRNLARTLQSIDAVKSLTAGDVGAANLQHGFKIIGLGGHDCLGGLGGAVVLTQLAQGVRHLYARNRVHRIDGVFVAPKNRTAEGVGAIIGGPGCGICRKAGRDSLGRSLGQSAAGERQAHDQAYGCSKAACARHEDRFRRFVN